MHTLIINNNNNNNNNITYLNNRLSLALEQVLAHVDEVLLDLQLLLIIIIIN